MRRVSSVIVATVVGWVVLVGDAVAANAWTPGKNVEQIVVDNVKPVWKIFVLVGTIVVLAAFRRPVIVGSFAAIVLVSGIMIWGIDGIANQMTGLADQVNNGP